MSAGWCFLTLVAQRDKKEEPREQNDNDAEDAPIRGTAHGDEQGKECWCQKTDGAAGRGIEAEDLTLATGRSQASEECAAG